MKVLFSNNPMLMSQLRFKSVGHNLYTEESNKIALCSNYGKILQTIYNTTSYPYGTSLGKVCKTKLLHKC